MGQEKSRKVSVNIPVYNGGKTIARTVQSVLSQSFADFELVIVNDASRDSTPQILNEFQDPRIKVIHHEQNQGISRTRNTALKNSSGDYVMILDADDLSVPDRMKKQVQAFDQDPSLDGSFSWTAGFTTNPDEAVCRYFPRPDPSETKELILFESPFAHSSACIRRRVMGQGYREDLSCAEDYAKWLELIFSGKRLHVIPEPLIKSMVHPPTNYSWEKMRTNVKKLHAEYFNEVFGKALSAEEADAQWSLYNVLDCAPSSRQEAIALVSGAERWIATVGKLESRDSSIVRARLLDHAYRQLYLLAARFAPMIGSGVMRFTRRLPPVKRLKLLVKSQLPMSRPRPTP
jgi:glycosyltransferase involved in cell wall biosynthesis